MAAMMDSKYRGSRGLSAGVAVFCWLWFLCYPVWNLVLFHTHAWWWRDHGEQQSESAAIESPRRGGSRGESLRQCLRRARVSRIAFGDNLKVMIHIVSLLFPWSHWPLPYILRHDWSVVRLSIRTRFWLFKSLRHSLVSYLEKHIERMKYRRFGGKFKHWICPYRQVTTMLLHVM